MNQPLAYVHPEAKVAKNVVIEPFVTIDKNVEIGEGTWIGSNVTIMEGARIGCNCKIYPGAVISANPQDLKYRGEDTITVIGDNTTIREFVTVNRATRANWETKVGNNCLIMAYAHIAHDCVVGNNCILANGVTLAGHVIVEDYVNIGGLVAVQQFVHIGAHSMTAGGSLVRKDVPPYVKCAREPLSYVGINSIGLRRRGFSSEKIAQLQEIYRIIYLDKLNVTQALDIIEAKFPATIERDEILSFISKSSVGILKGYTAKN